MNKLLLLVAVVMPLSSLAGTAPPPPRVDALAARVGLGTPPAFPPGLMGGGRGDPMGDARGGVGTSGEAEALMKRATAVPFNAAFLKFISGDWTAVGFINVKYAGGLGTSNREG